MEDKTKKTRSFAADTARTAVPILVPMAVKAVFNFIPAGSKLDQILENYQTYWMKALPALNLIILRMFNAPDMVDDILSELSAEVVEAIKERYKDGDGAQKQADKGSDTTYRISEAIALLSAADFAALNTKIISLSKERRRLCLRYTFKAKDEKAAKKFLSLLAKLSDPQFTAWADLMFPEREESEFEKGLKKSLEEFKDDVSAATGKDGPLTKWAKKLGV